MAKLQVRASPRALAGIFNPQPFEEINDDEWRRFLR
jgi:hypothetical protein